MAEATPSSRGDPEWESESQSESESRKSDGELQSEALKSDGELQSENEVASSPADAGSRIMPGITLESPTPSEVKAFSVAGSQDTYSQEEEYSQDSVNDAVDEADEIDEDNRMSETQTAHASSTKQSLNATTTYDDDFEDDGSPVSFVADCSPKQSLNATTAYDDDFEDEGALSDDNLNLAPSVPGVETDAATDEKWQNNEPVDEVEPHEPEEQDPFEERPKRRGGPKRHLSIEVENASHEEPTSTYLDVEPMPTPQTNASIDEMVSPGSLARRTSATQVSSVMDDFEKLRKSLFGERSTENQLLASELELQGVGLDDEPLPRALVHMADLSIKCSVPLMPYSAEVPSPALGGGSSNYNLAHGRKTNHRTAFGEPPPRSMIGRHITIPVTMADCGDESEGNHEQPLRSHQASRQGTEPPPSPTISDACKESMQKVEVMPWSEAVLKPPCQTPSKLHLPPVGAGKNTQRTSQRRKGGDPKIPVLGRLYHTQDCQRRHPTTPSGPHGGPPSPNGNLRQGKSNAVAATGGSVGTTAAVDNRTTQSPAAEEKRVSEEQRNGEEMKGKERKEGEGEERIGEERTGEERKIEETEEVERKGDERTGEDRKREETKAVERKGDLKTVVPGSSKISPRPPPAPRSGAMTAQQAAAARVALARAKEHKPQVGKMPWMTLAMQEPPLRWQKYFEREKPEKGITMFKLKPGELLSPMLKS